MGNRVCCAMACCVVCGRGACAWYQGFSTPPLTSFLLAATPASSSTSSFLFFPERATSDRSDLELTTRPPSSPPSSMPPSQSVVLVGTRRLSVSRSSRAPLVCCQQDETRHERALNPSSMEMSEIRIDVPEVHLLRLLLPVVLPFPSLLSWRSF